MHDADKEIKDRLEVHGGTCEFHDLVVINQQPYIPCSASLRSVRQHIIIETPATIFGKGVFNIVMPPYAAKDLNVPQVRKVAILVDGDTYRVAVKLHDQWFSTYFVHADMQTPQMEQIDVA